MVIFGNEMNPNALWWYELYVHPDTWSIPLQITLRWNDIYALSILCFTFQVTRNEFYGDD
jgi:hypothetical protein